MSCSNGRIDVKFLGLFLAWVLVNFPALAQQGDCGFIQNLDRQAYCRATSGGGTNQCGFIRDRDMQAACRAKTR
jgi:hypothetical protein